MVKKRSHYCGRFFIPDPRAGNRQKACSIQRQKLRNYGVDTQFVLRYGKRIGIYFLEVGFFQRSSKVIYDRKGSAISEIKPGMVDWPKVFVDACWLHWFGITPALSDRAAETVLKPAGRRKRPD